MRPPFLSLQVYERSNCMLSLAPPPPSQKQIILNVDPPPPQENGFPAEKKAIEPS